RQDVPARLEGFIQVASPLVAARRGEVRYGALRYSNGSSVGRNAPARAAPDVDSTTPGGRGVAANCSYWDRREATTAQAAHRSPARLRMEYADKWLERTTVT